MDPYDWFVLFMVFLGGIDLLCLIGVMIKIKYNIPMDF